MRENRLLNRLRMQEKGISGSFTEDPKQVILSVQGHLQQMLNTRWGSVPIADDFGIPDFTDILSSYPESVRDLERSLRQTIQKFEPRLKNVRVKFIPQEEGDLAVSFQISAKLNLERLKDSVIFESQLDSDGRISIKG